MRRAPGRGAEDLDVADVFADPAFAPSKARGAGFAIVRPAVRDVVWANAAAAAHWGADDARALARALFGGGDWLGTATRGLVPGGAPRLARAGLSTPSLRARTILARSWAGADGTVLLAFALPEASSGPGAPPDAWRRGAWAWPGDAPEDGAHEADAPDGGRDADAVDPTRTELARRSQVAVLRDRLSAAIDGATVLRLLWRTDGRGIVTRIDADAFARLGSPVRFGPLPLPDTVAAFDAAAGEALRGALASGATWSGVTLSLPVADTAAVVPMTMSASPVFGADRRFAGFRGFGTLDLARLDLAARADTGPRAEPGPAPAEPERPAADAPPDTALPPADDPGSAAVDRSGERPASRRVVRLRAVPAPERVPPAAEAADGSGVDQAFRALGDALRARIAARNEDGPTAPEVPIPSAASETDGTRAGTDDSSAPVAGPPDPSPDASTAPALPPALPPGLLAALPAAVLVTVDGATAYANDAAAALLGHPDAASLLAAGAASPIEGAAAAEGVSVRRRDGRADAVSADGWPIAWNGAAATLWLLRGRDAPPAAPAPSADGTRGPAPDERSGELLDRVDDAVALLDADGRIRRLNERGAAWFGGADAVGKSFTQLLAADSRAAGLALLEEVRGRRDGSLPPERRDVLARTADPAPVPMLLTLGRLGAQGFYATLRDVSALRRAEIEGARAQRDRTRDAGRLTELLAKVDHGVRTPLNAILGFAEVMMDERFGALGNPRYRDYLRDIHAAGTQVVRMIGDLFDLSRIEAGQIDGSPAAVDLNRIVGDTVGRMQPEAHRERVIMRMSLAARLAPILADERSVRQIVQHLLSNAVKFNEPGGQVIVSTAQGEAGTATLRVRDTGIGMTGDEVAVALEPFGRAASSGAKDGLGLPLTRALVDANRASIAIRSRPGEGTLIEVVFTAADPDGAPLP